MKFSKIFHSIQTVNNDSLRYSLDKCMRSMPLCDTIRLLASLPFLTIFVSGFTKLKRKVSNKIHIIAKSVSYDEPAPDLAASNHLFLAALAPPL